MSILDALRQQTGSIDDLAKLPQAMIMQMAQKGQIRQDLVLPILSRKAEMTQAAARSQAMQQPAPQSVAEQLLAMNTQAEMGPQDTGVAQLPINPDMYNEQRMAGGGIVAFQDNPDQPVDENMPATDESNPYLSFDERLRGMRPMSNPFMPRQPSLFTRGVEAIKQFPTQVGRFQPKSMTSEDVRRRMPAEPIAGSEQKLFDDEALLTAAAAAKTARPKTAPTLDAAGNIIPPASASKTKQAAATAANVVGDATGVSKPSAYEEMLLKQGEDAKKARQESKYLRMLEAGLGIMGGTSQYALTNIGQGAMGAAKGYAEDVKGFRTEERERAKILGTLGMEKEKIAADREKTAMLERRYKEMSDIERQKIGVLATQNRDEKTARLVGQAFNTLMSEYKTRLDRGEVTPSDLYLQAQQMVSSSLGTNVGGAPAAPANPTLSWSSLTSKAK